MPPSGGALRLQKRASLDPTLPDVPGAAESGLLVQTLTELPLQGCVTGRQQQAT